MKHRPDRDDPLNKVQEPDKGTRERHQVERELETELKRFRALYELAIAMTAERSLDENLQLVVEKSRELLNSDTAYVALRDRSRGDVFIHTLSGIRTEAFRKMRLPFGKGLGGLVAKTRQGYIVEDYFADRRLERVVDPIVADEGVISGMAVPIQMGPENLGVLYVFNRTRSRFLQSELDTLSLLGNLAAVEISRRRAEAELKAARSELENRVRERTADLLSTNEQLRREIEERNRVEEALRNSEERYRRTFETAPDSITISTLDEGRFLDVNEAFCQLTGYTREEALGRTVFDLDLLVDPAGRDRITEGLKQQGEVNGLEMRYRSKAGRIMDMLLSARPLTYGGEDAMVSVVTDITERKRAEEALRLSEEKYRTILESIEEGYFESDISGRITFCNDAACKISGYSREEFLGLNNRDFSSPESAKKMYHFFNQVYQTGNPARLMDCEAIRKDGSTRIIEMSASLMRAPDGTPTGFRGMVRDVTDRKEIEEALRQSEENYRTVVSNATDSIFIAQDGVVKFPNPQTEEMTGYSAEELGRIPFTTLIHPEERDMVAERHQMRLKGEDLPSTYSFRIQNRSGRELWVELSTVRIQWGGRPATLNYLRDITQQKQLESQLQHAQKMESIGSIASGVAHNFRNIMAGILVNTQLMEMKFKESSDLSAIAHRINDAVNRGAQLVDGLMQFSRKQEMGEFKVLNMSEVVKEACDLIGKSFDKRIRVRMALPKNLAVMGDYSSLSQVVMNLCINARDAMPEGGELGVSAEQQEERVKILISDTGHGMDEGTLSKCFDPFFTTKEVGRGTGLGLSTSYGIIKEHGGEILAQSEKGKGTTFEIRLPVETMEPEACGTAPSRLIHGRGQKILIVDDEIDLLKPMEDLIASMGYTAASVSNGADALGTYAAWRPDAVLLDRNMPGMDGVTCAVRIMEQDHGARIILMSGYDERGPEGIDSQTREMISGYLTKPVELLELSEVLSRVLEQ